MSKHSRPILLLIATAVAILRSSSQSAGQDLSVTATVEPSRPGILSVAGRYVADSGRPVPTYLSFLKEYAGSSGLGGRISNVTLKDVNGNVLPFKAFQAGEYVADREIGEFSYSMDVTPLRNPAAAGHISWIGPNGGILFLNDLLPESQSAIVTLNGLNGLSATQPDGSGQRYSFLSRSAGVLVVRPDSLAPMSIEWAGKKILLSSTTATPESSRETLDMAMEIFKGYSERFGPSASATNVLLVLEDYPVPVDLGSYEADTRGSTITIVSSGPVFGSQTPQHLHEQLRHEMFHLWIPEGVNLTGNYDWFYEGFALYQSLKLGVGVNRIRFDDYLDTLSRAYDINRRLGVKTSLIEASRHRWSGDNNTLLYARGMLVAFLCDLALLDNSKGKRSSDDLVRGLYQRYSGGTAAGRDGNDAAISLLKENRELIPIVDDYVSGTKQLVWEDAIKAAGLQAETKSGVTNLSVAAKPNGHQKRLLDKLGYNNWRKLSSK